MRRGREEEDRKVEEGKETNSARKASGRSKERRKRTGMN